MCNCKEWCRDWRETEGGKYPKSDHAPGCEDYKTERFVRVEYDGTACVMEPAEAQAMVDDAGEGIAYILSDVFLTRDQFDRMGEFAGF